jgi:hypothetical protein
MDKLSHLLLLRSPAKEEKAGGLVVVLAGGYPKSNKWEEAGVWTG